MRTGMHSKERGVTVIETLGALAIGTLILFGLTTMIDSSIEDLEGQQLALYQSQVVQAANDYITANYATLTATLATTPAVAVDVTTLQDGNFLPAGFASTNPYGNPTCVVVRERSAGSGRLDALIFTSGTKQIAERHIATVAANAGMGGGYISTDDPLTARGSAWSLPTATYVGIACPDGTALAGDANDAGHLVSALFYDGPGQRSTDFLYRNEVAENRELNTMNTPLRLGGGAVVAAGSACDGAAAIAVDAGNDLLKCDPSTLTWNYMTTWKPPVSSYAALPVTDRNGDVRMALDTGRAFMYNAASGTWTALAVDQNGNLTVPQNVVVQNGNVNVQSGNIYAANDIEAGNNITAGFGMYARQVEVGEYLHSRGISLSTAYSQYEACHIPVPVAGGGWAYINPIGTVVRDGSYRLMICMPDSRFDYINDTY